MRRRRVCALVTVLSFAGCSSPEPAVSEEDVAVLRESLPGISEACVDKYRDGGVEAIPHSVDACFQFSDATEWSGVWRDEFEGSIFCLEASDACSYSEDHPNIWLTFANEDTRPRSRNYGLAPELYRVRFIGRMSKEAGHFGHEGAFSRAVIVDRLISADKL